jgi:hypothetical protein
MCGDIAVDQATGLVLDHDKYVQHAKAGRDREAEIAGQHSLGMQAQEGRPPQIPSRAARWMPRHILADRAGRDPDIQLQ